MPQGGSTVEVNDFNAPDGVFIIGTGNCVPHCCGGVRQLSTKVGEIKRVFVRSDVRRQGIGQQLLTELEDRAGALGFSKLLLDTRTAEAAALFAGAGYEPIPDYNRNPYARYWFTKQTQGRN